MSGPAAEIVFVRAAGRADTAVEVEVTRLLRGGSHRCADLRASSSVDDVRAALDSVEAGALAVVAAGPMADTAIVACATDPRVVAVAILGGAVSPAAVRLIGQWKEVPVFVIADTADRSSLGSAVALRQASTHPDSDIEFVGGLDIGAARFGTRAASFTDAAAALASWLDQALASVAERRDVVASSDDGWEIHGSLIVPSRRQQVPAAVLLHSGRSDRAVFSRLERLLARRGVATLSIDWRGRGRSQNRGTYFDLSAAERAEGYRDARAAMALLEEHPGVDAGRVAMVGVVHGAEHAVAASVGDPRVKLLCLLTGYRPRNDGEEAHLLSGSVQVMYVTGSGHGPVTEAMRALARRSPPGCATLIEYPGGAIGYQLFDLDPRLEESIAVWVAEGLAAERIGATA